MKARNLTPAEIRTLEAGTDVRLVIETKVRTTIYGDPFVVLAEQRIPLANLRNTARPVKAHVQILEEPFQPGDVVLVWYGDPSTVKPYTYVRGTTGWLSEKAGSPTDGEIRKRIRSGTARLVLRDGKPVS